MPGTDSPKGGHEGGDDGTHKDGLRKLMLGALGVVFGDIGTSPLYALRETFIGHHPLAVDRPHVYGIVSLVFWTMTLIVSIKYVTIIMRADNRGEGGAIALQALLMRSSRNRAYVPVIMVLGILATALFFADSIITPAISVLSALEGLMVVEARLEPLVLPLALGIIIALFLIQSYGTRRVGAFFGPVMLVYFTTLAGLGLVQIWHRPDILLALSPHYALQFFLIDKWLAFLALSSVVLAVTGAEALYADMGHFGRVPIRFSWLWIVMPALMLNYLGQSALLIGDPAAIRNPFFLLAPDQLRLPLVILATIATVIASQAVISGAFSVTRQAVQLGYLPRLRIMHTSASTEGQIYIPFVNWAMLVLVLLLVMGFRNSSSLAAAYGISVTGTMFLSTCMMAVLILSVWRWNRWLAVPIVATQLIVDGAYFTANLTKIPAGGWFPLLLGIVIFTLLTTWARGRHLMRERMKESAMPMEVFVKSAARAADRVPGTAVFMASSPDGVPHALLHNLKHNKVLHERILVLTILIKEVPFVAEADRVEVIDIGENFYRLILRYGFMQQPDVPRALVQVEHCGPQIRMMDTSFFLSRQTLLPSHDPGMPIWRERLFAWMLRNAESAMEFFRLPTNRVVELGSQVEI